MPITAVALLKWFIGPIGKYFTIALIVTAVLGTAWTKGYLFEHKRWVRAEEKAIEKGNQAHDDAERSVATRKPDNWLRHDRFNRD